MINFAERCTYFTEDDYAAVIFGGLTVFLYICINFYQ
ncbi:hypothetical protein SAMN06298210_11226 [Prevotellaceae bacterium KH2P17]|nr:hypothetical protein SAMN06298210_11226 [Prevotellaceae bacterium KH2P17]